MARLEYCNPEQQLIYIYIVTLAMAESRMPHASKPTTCEQANQLHAVAWKPSEQTQPNLDRAHQRAQPVHDLQQLTVVGNLFGLQDVLCIQGQCSAELCKHWPNTCSGLVAKHIFCPVLESLALLPFSGPSGGVWAASTRQVAHTAG